MKIETSLEWGEQQDTGEKSYTITKSRKTQQHNIREDKDYQNKTGRSNIWIITQNQCGVRGLVHTVSTFSLKCFQGNLSHVGPNGSLQWEDHCRHHVDEGTGRCFGRRKTSRVLSKREEAASEANVRSHFWETAELGLLHDGKICLSSCDTLAQNLRMHMLYVVWSYEMFIVILP